MINQEALKKLRQIEELFIIARNLQTQTATILDLIKQLEDEVEQHVLDKN